MRHAEARSRSPLLLVVGDDRRFTAQAARNVPPAISKAPKYGYTVVRSYPHDPKAYTQGLEYFEGVLYEGTGQKGRSADQESGHRDGKGASGRAPSPRSTSARGSPSPRGRLFQLTWRDRTGFVYDARSLKFIRNFSYFGEGWGLTHEPAGLIMSDGTSTLRFLELTRFQERRRVKVTDAAVPDRASERARMGPRRDLGECVGDRLHRPDLAEGWPGAGMDRSQGSAERAGREARARSRAERYRLRCAEGSDLRDREIVAASVRDSVN